MQIIKLDFDDPFNSPARATNQPIIVAPSRSRDDLPVLLRTRATRIVDPVARWRVDFPTCASSSTLLYRTRSTLLQSLFGQTTSKSAAHLTAASNFRTAHHASMHPTPRTTMPDLEDSDSPKETDSFTYDPKAFHHRLLVSCRFKTKLDTSQIIRLPYNRIYKYLLIILLLLFGAFLTPQLIPRWIGFEWASPQDLCQAPNDKLLTIRRDLINITRLHDAEDFLLQQDFTLKCMNRSAQVFYHGPTKNPPRFQWPKECNSEKAQVSLTETTCVQQDANVCDAVGGFFGFLIGIGGNCVREIGPEICTNTTDANRSDALLELEQKRRLPRDQRNVTLSETEPIVSTANVKVQDIISRLITQVDIAADAFILYSLISIAIGIPLIVSKREKTSRVVGATFGLTKVMFIVIFVIIISVYDSMTAILKETDFARLFQNFLNDPCYVNPHFSAKRAEAIVEICNNISYVDARSDITLQKMDAVFYDTRLFGFCKDDIRPLAEHPKLSAMDDIRKAYRSGSISNPGICNATRLNELTSVAPESDRIDKWKALLGSGVIPQLAIKFILTSWLLHLFGYVEPMVIHGGKVEIWGAQKNAELTDNEKKAIRRFARDKHLLALLILSVLLILEVALIIYSISTTINGRGEIPEESPVIPRVAPNLTCPTTLLPL